MEAFGTHGPALPGSGTVACVCALHKPRIKHSSCVRPTQAGVTRSRRGQPPPPRLLAMDIGTVNSMDFGEFVDVFGNVVERCPVVAAAVWSQRPFRDADDLAEHFSAFLDALPVPGKARAPPRGRRAPRPSARGSPRLAVAGLDVRVAVFIVRFTVPKLLTRGRHGRTYIGACKVAVKY